jgi:hypothetical protein
MKSKVPIGVVVLFVFALFGKALSLAHAADESAPDIKVLPPIVIQGKFSEFVCGARFRYHIPGNNLKELVLRKIPKNWEKAGVSIGDSIIAIDDQAIDGLGIVALGKYLHSKPKTGTFDFTCDVRSKKAKTVQRIEAKFERDSGGFSIVYP